MATGIVGESDSRFLRRRLKPPPLPSIRPFASLLPRCYALSHDRIRIYDQDFRVFRRPSFYRRRRTVVVALSTFAERT